MRRRDDPMLHSVLLLLGDMAVNSGRWGEATEYINEAHEVVVQTARQSAEPECMIAKARIAMLRGEVDLARELAKDAVIAFDRVASAGERRVALDGPMFEGLV